MAGLVIVVVMVVSLLQAAGIALVLLSGPIIGEHINESGLRRSMVLLIALRSEHVINRHRVGDRRELRAAIDELIALDKKVGDPSSPKDRALFDGFVSAANRVAGGRAQSRDAVAISSSTPQLFSAFNKSIERDASSMLNLRGRIRALIVGGSAVIVLVAGTLYFIVLRPALLRGERLIDELAERRERLTAIFEGSPDPMALYSVYGDLTKANSAATKLFGFVPGSVGKRFDFHVSATSKSLVENAFASVKNGDSAQYEAIFVRGDGKEVPVAATLFPIRVAGRVVEVCGIVKDLSSITEAQRAVRESAEYFRSLFEGASDPMALYDTGGLIVRGNAASASLLGFSGSIIGKPYSVHVAPEMHGSADACFSNALQGRQVEFESIFLTSENARIPVLASLSPIRVDGEIVGIFGVAKDLTEIRLAEEAMLRSENEFRSIFDFNQDASFATDLQFRIVRVNTALETMLGKKAENLLMTDVVDLFPPDERPILDKLAEKIRAGEISTIETRLLGIDGRELEIVARSIPMFAQGTLSGAFHFLRDVTELRAAERREALQRERLGAVALLAAAHAIDVDEQVERILSFGLMSFGMQAGEISIVQGNEVVALNGMGEAVSAGTRMPIERTFTRLFFGQPDPFCVDDIDASDVRNDPAGEWQHWRSIIGATIFVSGVPTGTVIFLGRLPRTSPFDDGDRSFLQVVASLIGSAMERDRQQRELDEHARTDALTGLPNRPAFYDALRAEIARAHRSRESVSVLFCALDGFSAVNDAFGHDAGDATLRAVADRFRSTLRDGDYLSRVGGDEFLVYRYDALNDNSGERLAEQVVQSLSQPFELDGVAAQVGVYVGFALFPDDADSADDLIRLANEARRDAKSDGKGPVARARRERRDPTA